MDAMAAGKAVFRFDESVSFEAGTSGHTHLLNLAI
jgi:hypothetical protein